MTFTQHALIITPNGWTGFFDAETSRDDLRTQNNDKVIHQEQTTNASTNIHHGEA